MAENVDEILATTVKRIVSSIFNENAFHESRVAGKGWHYSDPKIIHASERRHEYLLLAFHWNDYFFGIIPASNRCHQGSFEIFIRGKLQLDCCGLTRL